MNLIQFLDKKGARRVGEVVNKGPDVRVLGTWERTYDLALAAARKSIPLADLVFASPTKGTVQFDELIALRHVLPPLDHPDPAHCLVSGTGLTHRGSAQTRDSMHARIAAAGENLTDSMRIFRWGVEGGRPADGSPPVQPEWFYKGDGSFVVPPEHALERPAFADDGGEEAELVGLYVVADDGTPCRVGFALGNEFSDHVMEKKNYLYLAHSKLRTCSFGPELLVGNLPASVTGRVRVRRGTRELWSAPFATGEANMSYRIAGLEHHHFKYRQFRRAGDVHCHFFGAAVLSCSFGVAPEDGDVFEISAPPFNRPLRNPLRIEPASLKPVTVFSL